MPATSHTLALAASFMRGRVSIKQRLIGLIGILFSLTILSIGVLLLVFEKSASGMLIVTSGMFLWIGLGFSGLLLMNMKTIDLDNNKLTIGTFYGLIKKQYDMTEIESYNLRRFENGFGNYPGFLLRFRDGRQVHIHKMEFNNYGDFENNLLDKVTHDKDLNIEIWTSYAKLFVVCGGLILLSLVIVKSFGL